MRLNGKKQEEARCRVPEHLPMVPNGVSRVGGSIMSPKSICKSSATVFGD